MTTSSECRYRWLRVPATKIDLADQALGLLCLGFFVGMSRWMVGLEKDPEIIGLVYRTRP